MKQTRFDLREYNDPARPNIKYYVTGPKLNGKRWRRFYATLKEAKTGLELKRAEIENYGTKAFEISDKLRVEAIEANERLRPLHASITDAVDFYLRHARPTGGTKEVREVIDELLMAKRKAGKRESYTKILGWVLKAFARNFEERNINDITWGEVEKYLDANFANIKSRDNRIRDLKVLFTFASKRNYCGSNPMNQIERPTLTAKRPEIFTVTEAAALLTAAEAHPELELAPAIAIGLFAGLRMNEMKQLDWRHIDLQHGVIDVSEEIAKTRQQRNVDMIFELEKTKYTPLVAWLAPYAKSSGSIIPTGFRGKILRLRELAEITNWPDNGLRHSFGSYHVAQFQNPNMTALQMGHATTDMLFKHYRNYRIAKRDAERYWNIRPASADNLVAMTA